VTAEEEYGIRLMREWGIEDAVNGMYANLGIRLTRAGPGWVELTAHPTAASHGFPTADGPIIHGGAVATIADCALACAAGTAAESSTAPVTADLRVEFFRPTRPGAVVAARGEVRHRTRRLAYCSATLTQGGEVVAEARATIAYVRTARVDLK